MKKTKSHKIFVRKGNLYVKKEINSFYKVLSNKQLMDRCQVEIGMVLMCYFPTETNAQGRKYSRDRPFRIKSIELDKEKSNYIIWVN